jgi:serine/threonine-protein kinase HipA
VIDGKTIKHHIQTLCAINHLDFRQRGTHDYSQLFMTASALGLDDGAVDQIFRRMAFNVMARNCDDHTKNFGFILRQGQPWNLAPAYDVTHAYNPKGEWTYQHQMSVNQKFEDISKEDLLAVADRFSVRKPENALSAVRAAIDNWSQFAKRGHLSPTLQNRIANQLLPL